MKKKTQKFTILHSNDMHGDFLSEVKEGSGQLIGGLGLLSGYLNKVRQEEENVIYVIAGDMVQGSLIDSEYKGISTIEIMNYLSPDVVTLGNHELDYGLPHLLFLEKVANFPIVNANLYMKQYGKRLMTPYIIKRVGGFNILFIGIITEKVMAKIAQDQLIGTFVSIEDAAEEIGKICNTYKNEDIDLTVALTHIGFESDIELAKMLNPEWGVDMIIGGHSHTILDQPEEVNNILIAQAGTGTEQIGRFDIVVDEKTNAIIDWQWQLVPINDQTAEIDASLQEFIHSYKDMVDEKYNAIVTRFSEKLMHPNRQEETTLGNMMADALADQSKTHVVLLGSGSIRGQELGPVVTLGSLKACFPFEDSLTRYTISGEQLWKIFSHIMRIENRNGEGECFQINNRVKARYCDVTLKLVSLTVDDIPVMDNQAYTITLQGYHVTNSMENLGVSEEELFAMGIPQVVSTSDYQVLEEWLRYHSNITRKIEGRLVFESIN
ncbi:MAG TPA: bifunctional metallophosphatase/5'-nucleotidase [Epulopiscium sp.]|nr:bifunctional metallophosphatase/5'-nucleotidase [Candidatus Epulonipiscium sp.]